jgi:hypothetical protein
MKKRIGMITTAILILFLSFVFAEDKVQNKNEAQPAAQTPEMKESGMMGQGMMGQGMMGQGMMGQGMMGQGMMGSMMDKKIVATQDGGIVVWAGNKLIKYDKDLKLVKEVELKIDMAQMKQQMMEDRDKMGCSGGPFKAGYPYHRKMGATQTEEEVDPHAIDPYHHAPKN